MLLIQMLPVMRMCAAGVCVCALQPFNPSFSLLPSVLPTTALPLSLFHSVYSLNSPHILHSLHHPLPNQTHIHTQIHTQISIHTHIYMHKLKKYTHKRADTYKYTHTPIHHCIHIYTCRRAQKINRGTNTDSNTK